MSKRKEKTCWWARGVPHSGGPSTPLAFTLGKMRSHILISCYGSYYTWSFIGTILHARLQSPRRSMLESPHFIETGVEISRLNILTKVVWLIYERISM